MHKLGVAGGILRVALDVSGDDRVERVEVSAGRLQAIDVRSLQFSFELVAAGSRAEGCALDVVTRDGDALTVDSVTCAGESARVVRRPGLGIVEDDGGHHHHDQDPGADLHAHPAWR